MNSSQFVLAASGSVYDPCPGTDIPQNCAGGGLGLDFWTINENRTVVQAFQGIY
ncbi:hypothetical protein K2X30_02175 [bacterium]|nr:hypothetical protein [bacterium]